MSITISIIEEFLPLRKRGNWKMFMFCAQLEIAGAIFLQPACASCHQPTVPKHWDDIQNNWLTGIIQHMDDSLASTYESRLLFFSVSSKLISFNFFVCIITTATAARITYSSPTSTLSPPHLQETAYMTCDSLSWKDPPRSLTLNIQRAPISGGGRK